MTCILISDLRPWYKCKDGLVQNVAVLNWGNNNRGFGQSTIVKKDEVFASEKISDH